MSSRILALDPAENFGYAIDTGDLKIWGTWTFKLKKDESFSMKLIRFEAKLDEMVKLQKINLIAFERPSGRMPSAIMSHAKFVGIIEVYCTRNEIPYKGYSAKEIKKHATNNGNASKIMMVKAAIIKLRYRGKNDNEADAMWILDLFKEDMGLKT